MLTERAKKLLNELDVCMSEEDPDDAGSLYAVLTALRGPDSRDCVVMFSGGEDLSYDVKSSTTAILRRKTFPITSKAKRGVFRLH